MKKSVLPYYLPALSVLLVAMAFTESASAQIITVPNFSFETPADTSATVPYHILGTTNSTGATDPLTDWNYTTNNVRGYGVVATSTLTTPGTSQGSQAAYLQVYNGGNFGTLTTANSLGVITPFTLYTLTVAVGAPATFTGSPATGGVTTAGKTAGEAIFGLTGNGTIFASQSVAPNLVSQGTLVDYTVTFTTGASGGDIGKALGISLESLKDDYPGNVDPGYESDIFDNVRLTAVSTIPEPSTYAMIGLGLLSLFAFGKFRKRAA
jgi:hypothetical protein